MGRWLGRGALGLAGLALAAILATVGYCGWRAHRTVILPSLTGPLGVGRRLYAWTDAARTDPFSPGGRAPRTLSVWVWYPASSPAGAPTAPYLPSGWAQATAATAGLQPLVATVPQRIRTHAVADAALSSARATWPILVFAPGLGLGVADYTTLLEDLASQGYVVAALNPTYSTPVLLFGRAVPAVPQAGDDADPSQLTSLWAGDMQFVAAQMASGAAPQFAGHLQLPRVGFLGHSLGGAAAAQACSTDADCAGAVDIDGDLFGPVLSTGVGKPFLFLGAEGSLAEDVVAQKSMHETQIAFRSQLVDALRGVPNGAGYVFTVVGTGHFSFTDRAVTFWVFKNLRGIGAPGGARVLQLTQAYVTAFFGAHLEGRPGDLLSQGSPPSAMVQRHSVA